MRSRPSQGEVALPDAALQPDGIFARDRLGLVTAHLARFDAAGFVGALGPIDGRADRAPKLLGGLIAGHPAFDRRHNPLPKVKRIKRADLGIPNRFRLISSRFSPGHPRLACFRSDKDVDDRHKAGA